MIKFYRTDCFTEIGGFVREVMWDGIDCHTCRMFGWIAESYDDASLRFLHLRPMGSSHKGIFTGRMRHGFGQWFMGTGLAYMTASGVFRMTRPPVVVGGLAMWWGYVKSMLMSKPRYDQPAFRRFLRSYQWACLFKGKAAATRALNASGAVRFAARDAGGRPEPGTAPAAPSAPLTEPIQTRGKRGRPWLILWVRFRPPFPALPPRPTRPRPHGIDVSICVPVYNEEGSVARLYAEIAAVMDGGPAESPPRRYEAIFVSDGSYDASVERLHAAAAGDPRVRIIELMRNFGQTAAMAASFDAARGDVIVPMDGDLQNDPADIPKLVSKLDENGDAPGRWDIVSGWRKDRKDGALLRKLPSRIANRLIKRLTWTTEIHDFGCSMKAYRAVVLKDVTLYGEMHRFLPAICKWRGARVTEMVVNHRAREHGQSKYGLRRTFKVLLDLLTVKFLGDYGTKPIYFFGKLAAFGFIAAAGLLAGDRVPAETRLVLDRKRRAGQPEPQHLLLRGAVLLRRQHHLFDDGRAQRADGAHLLRKPGPPALQGAAPAARRRDRRRINAPGQRHRRRRGTAGGITHMHDRSPTNPTPDAPADRASALARLGGESSRHGEERFDVLVVGAGVYGAWVALDAAQRGLKVALVDRGDFGAATSANSQRILHGGFRYLQHADFKRMRESIRERSTVMRRMPHLVEPQGFLVPTTPRGVQRKTLMRIALKMNDWVSHDRNRGLPASKQLGAGQILSKAACLTRAPGLDPDDVTGGAVFYDGQIVNSERLVLSVVQSAAAAGATVANHVNVDGFIRDGDARVLGVHATDVLTGNPLEIRSALI